MKDQSEDAEHDRIAGSKAGKHTIIGKMYTMGIVYQ